MTTSRLWTSVSRPARRLLDRASVAMARRRVRSIDRRSFAAGQEATLRALVRRAAGTRFGRDHGFAEICSVEDYRRRVPLRHYEDFWRDYWQPAFPHLGGVTWPGEIPYFALSSGTTSGATKHIPVSREMLASNRAAALTALSWFRAAHPDARLLTGQMFLLGGSTNLLPARSDDVGRGQPLLGDLSGIAAKELPAFARPFAFPPLDLALLDDWERKLQLLAERSVSQSITLVGGVPSWLLALFDRLCSVAGRETIAEIWPELRLVIHGGTKFDPYRGQFRRLIGTDRVAYLETYPASEGFVAAEDPRHGLLRLIPDHGVFFEFVPVDQLHQASPERLTAAEVVCGEQYAVVLTTCAGLWSYVLGDTVAFESRDPPLLRFTGRTRQFLSAFGEHLIGEEVERAVAAAADRTGAEVVDFHVGPVFSESGGGAGRHRYLVEFARAPVDRAAFAALLDDALLKANDDYRAHRRGDFTLGAPEVLPAPRGAFAAWMRDRGQLGGQHKVPRMDNSGRLTEEFSCWLREEVGGDLSRVR